MTAGLSKQIEQSHDTFRSARRYMSLLYVQVERAAKNEDTDADVAKQVTS